MKNLAIFVCAAISIAALLACTPEVKITGDAEKPIAINANSSIRKGNKTICQWMVSSVPVAT